MCRAVACSTPSTCLSIIILMQRYTTALTPWVFCVARFLTEVAWPTVHTPPMPRHTGGAGRAKHHCFILWLPQHPSGTPTQIPSGAPGLVRSGGAHRFQLCVHTFCLVFMLPLHVGTNRACYIPFAAVHVHSTTTLAIHTTCCVLDTVCMCLATAGYHDFTS